MKLSLMTGTGIALASLLFTGCASSTTPFTNFKDVKNGDSLDFLK